MLVLIFPRNLRSLRDAAHVERDIEAIRPLEHVANNRATKLHRINIHPLLRKADGTRVTVADIVDTFSFGNGITMDYILLKNGEKIPAVWCVSNDVNAATLESADLYSITQR